MVVELQKSIFWFFKSKLLAFVYVFILQILFCFFSQKATTSWTKTSGCFSANESVLILLPDFVFSGLSGVLKLYE